MNVRKTIRWSALTAPLSVVFMVAPAALLPATAWSQNIGSSQIEEVVVSARRRDENAQDIPVAVASFDADFIQKQGVTSTEDILKLVPGVQFDQSFSSNDTRISIRGINSSRGRASVAVLVDGVDVSGESVTVGGGSSLLNTKLLDLERIEIVKGPQSALYGRSAFAGAINYITKKPSLDETDITVSGDYGTDDTYSMKGTVSGPVIPGKLALGLTAASYQSDGFYNNKLNGQDLNGYDSKGLRLSALWTPTDSITVDSSLAYEDNKADPRAVYKVANANTFYDAAGNKLNGVTDPTTPGIAYGNWLGTVGSGHESKVRFSNNEAAGRKFTGSKDEQWLATVKLSWDLDSVTFRSATSYLHNDSKINEDVDFQNGLGSLRSDVFFPGDGARNYSISNEFLVKNNTDQLNQEFILESNDWDRGTWLIGAQYYHEDVDNRDSSLNWYNDSAPWLASGFCGTAPMQVACTVGISETNGVPTKKTSRDTDSYSLFAQVIYDITEKLSATLEGRYIKDKIEVKTNTLFSRVDQTFFGLSAPQTSEDSQTTREFNPRGALDYQFTDDLMVYGSVARGTKPAGYGTAQFARPEFSELESEKLWAYEIGTKTVWFDSTLRANVALFFNDYDDRQVGITVTDPLNPAFFPAAGIANAGSAETKGAEVDLQWLATDYLTLGLGYAYTHTEWTDFDYRKIRPSGPTAKDRAICDNNGDCSGADIAGIPENALTLLADYRRPLGSTGLNLFVNANAAWEDERNLNDQKNTAKVDDHWRVDAQIGVENERWSAMIYATNLFDDDTVIWGQGGQNDFRDGVYGGFGAPRDDSTFAFLPDPRIVGVRASYSFGD